jgi:hypothetical protein
VPDFYVEGRTLTTKQLDVVFDFLQTRALGSSDGLQHSTAAYVHDINKMKKAYGETVFGFLTDYYMGGRSLT